MVNSSGSARCASVLPGTILGTSVDVWWSQRGQTPVNRTIRPIVLRSNCGVHVGSVTSAHPTSSPVTVSSYQTVEQSGNIRA